MAADPLPANDDAPRTPSLFDRAVAAARRRPDAAPVEPAPAPRRAVPFDRPALAVACAIVIAPLLTWGGATWLAASARADGRIAAARAAPAIAARDARSAALATLTQTWSRQPLGATIEGIARALPPEASLVRAEADAAGRLSLDIVTPDPDRLIAALRRDPALARLRPTAQKRVDGRMQVTLEALR
ncbi:hypothetical protein [Sphingomonas sp. Leaf4]|uniref:hypothetical protein n=1 Tax=Sphingomonas sp. Leaf4 TaxID=2876553 RepID=UPI001E55A70F|nr:hypothetical protein [Sphingomonas sp. Leaf4]